MPRKNAAPRPAPVALCNFARCDSPAVGVLVVAREHNGHVVERRPHCAECLPFMRQAYHGLAAVLSVEPVPA